MNIDHILNDHGFDRWFSAHYSHCTMADVLDCGSDALQTVYDDYMMDVYGSSHSVLLSSGWYVSYRDSNTCTAPDGVIYDRHGTSLVSRVKRRTGDKYPATLPMSNIFTSAEYDAWRSHFIV